MASTFSERIDVLAEAVGRGNLVATLVVDQV